MSSPVSSRSLLRRGTPPARWVLAAAVFGSGTPLLDVTVVGFAPSRRCQSRARSLSRIKVSRASRRHSGPPRPRQGVPDPADARVANLDHVLGVAYRGARACFTRSGSSARQQPKIAVHSHSTFIG